MTTFFWIERNRTKIFALELLIALIFGPLLGNSMMTGILGFIGVLMVQEITIVVLRFNLAKYGKEKAGRTLEKVKESYSNLKKEAKELGISTTDHPRKDYSKHKKKRVKQKKTHR
ncbi:MAG: hypothetical protein AABY15_06555 [Nanoarchaeota archaeon]